MHFHAPSALFTSTETLGATGKAKKKTGKAKRKRGEKEKIMDYQGGYASRVVDVTGASAPSSGPYIAWKIVTVRTSYAPEDFKGKVDEQKKAEYEAYCIGEMKEEILDALKKLEKYVHESQPKPTLPRDAKELKTCTTDMKFNINYFFLSQRKRDNVNDAIERLQVQLEADPLRPPLPEFDWRIEGWPRVKVEYVEN